MGLMDEIQQEQYAQRAPKCTVGKALLECDQEERADLIAALDDERYTGAAISRALTKLGYKVKAEALTRHRRGVCACAR